VIVTLSPLRPSVSPRLSIRNEISTTANGRLFFPNMSSDKASKHLQRIALALKVERSSLAEEMSPCDFCVRSRRRCVATSVAASRCSECIRHGRSGCNFKQKLPTMNDWASIDRQRKKLRDERDEAMAKVLRLSKMEKALEEREQKMIEMGVSTLEELDAAEAAEKEEQARLEASALALSEASDFFADPALDPAAFSDLPASFWDGLGFPGTASPPADPPPLPSWVSTSESGGTHSRGPDS
jgi:hypothetical protein